MIIKVEKFNFRSLNRNSPHETFIVKNPKKIEFWKALACVGFFGEIRVTEIGRIKKRIKK